ncbi:non-ribosomal peptide synthetase [Couchioplanes caeruleus]|uniref:Amino acid adenylation domain-containing protein/thioester reductase-like protein n=1 Tax=Couchioplanes caeruleus TaxID=56438 RepID=A0A3N1GDU5_9ACTN|nr:non-ribosomal peptide synthetase [Couchioplanes caeruleus]ROP28449.1 amino acid adenylation domain-containing protein/thioester reductase-like protein [Couchioplanes caeruleus]
MTTEATDRQALLRRLLAERGLARTETPIARREPHLPVPLSPLQEGLWFLDRLSPGSSAYVLSWAARLRGPLDPEALQGAVDTVVARHEALRTGLVPDAAGGARQRVLAPDAPRARVRIRHAELPGADAAAVDRAVRAEIETPFDLAAPPLLRALLIRLGAEDHALVLATHHIVGDDRSLVVIVRELTAAYAALHAGHRPELPPVGCQYPDYALWLRDRDGGEGLSRQRAYWAGRLDGVPDGLDLPTDRPRPAAASGRGGTREHRFPAGLRDGVDEVCRAHGATRFAVLLAALQMLLARLTGSDDICVGSPVTTRNRPELADAVGMFVNSVPIRTDLGGDPTLAEALDRVKAGYVEAIDHAGLPFDRIVEAARVSRRDGRNPLFQVMFVLNPPRGTGGRAVAGLAIEPLGFARDTTRMDLTFFVDDTGTGLRVVVDHDTDLYDAATVDRMVDRYRQVLAALVDRPGIRLSELDVRGPAERAAQVGWRGGRREYPGANVAELVAARAAAQPDAPAVVAGDEVVSYGELLARADRLARRLRAAGAGPEVPVGLALRASPAAVVAILGILRAGAGYLPLDPGHPPARLAALLAHAGAPLLVADAGIPGYGGTVLAPDGPEPDDPPSGAAPHHPDQLAYVIYTSGSTGTPKGVQVNHRSLVNLVHGFVEVHGFTPADRLLMLPPLSFDASAGDVFPALVSGAALLMCERPAELTGPALLAFCTRYGVTAVDAAAPLWRRWVADLADVRPAAVPPALRLVMVGGEAVPALAVQRWATLTGGRVPLVNHYGPTEGTVCATTHRSVDAAETTGAPLPIGVPLPNVRAYLLDGALREVPVGVTGELHLGGASPARGYLADPAATADRFLPDPFADRPGARMYRTGDLARQRVDGSLEFLGRADRQVKIRGHRIELAEVEAAVAALPGVRQVAVTARPELVAYVVGDDPPPAAAWRRALRERLPEYLVPAAFVVVAALPLNRHGKLDETALPPPGSATAAVPHLPPRTGTERCLARIWAELTGTQEPIGAGDSFFDVGGHSLLAGPLIARIAAELGAELPVRAVLAAADLGALASLVDGARSGTSTDGAAAAELERTLRADADLPDDVCAALPAGAPPAVPVTALVTGATGFLGAYLLRDLLDAGTAKVYCLVRAATGDAALARVRENLARYGLWRATDAERLTGLPGDLAAPNLGLTAAVADRLADTVDAVYHNGGAVNFLHSYAALRPANVQGTLEVLRLAGRGRPCAVHLVSTLGVYLTSGRIGTTVRESDPPDDSALGDGYNASKWVADALARAARERGLPVSVYRPARVTGDAATGVGNVDDWFSRLLVTCVQLGGVPDLGVPVDLAPVDHVVTAIGRLSRQSAGSDWHFYGRTLGHDELAAALAEYGYPVEPMPYPRWRAALLARPDAALAAFAPLFPPPTGEAGPPGGGQPRFDCSATEAAAGAPCPPVDAALLHRYLDHLVRAGALDRPTTVCAGALDRPTNGSRRA